MAHISMPQPNYHQLIALRKQRGMTQQEVADRIGTTPLSVSRWERGITTPSPYYLQKLTELFQPPLGVFGSDVSGSQAQHEWQLHTGTRTDSTARAVLDTSIPLLTTKLVGRDELLGTVKSRLLSATTPAFVALCGLPGVGKTALAAETVHDPAVQDHFTGGILWAGLGPEPHVQEILSRWGILLGVSESRLAQQGDDLTARLLMLKAIIGDRRVLIVQDDAFVVPDVLACQIGGPQCSYLTTTRFPIVAYGIPTAEVLPVPELEQPAALALLRKLAPRVIELAQPEVEQLVQQVGGLPLALVLIGNWLRKEIASGQMRRLSAAFALLLQAEERQRLEQPVAPVERMPSLPEGSSLSLQVSIAVSDRYLHAQERTAFYTLSLFAPKPNSFSEEAALAVAGCKDTVLDALYDVGLLESLQAGRYSFHQTISDYAQSARLKQPDRLAEQRLATYYVSFVERYSAHYSLLEPEISNLLQAFELAFGHEWWPELITGVCAFTPFLIARGLYTTAEQLLHQAYEAATRLGNQGERVRTLLYLGQIAHKQGNFAQAETEFFQKGLEMARDMGDSIHVIDLLTDLGWVLDKRGKYREAKACLEEGLELARQIGTRQQLCGLFKVLGSVTADMGDLARAVGFLREGLALAEQEGDQDLICVLLINLGATLVEQGNEGEAVQCFQGALTIAKALLHQEWTVLALLNLSDLTMIQGNLILAEEYIQTGLPLAQAIHHREWLSILLANQGTIRRVQGQFEQAEHFLQQALTLAAQIDRPSLTTSILYEIGLLRIDQHRADDADSLFQRMIELLPPDAPELSAQAQYGLARVAEMRGDLLEARRLGQLSLSTFEAIGNRLSQEVRTWLDSLPT